GWAEPSRPRGRRSCRRRACPSRTARHTQPARGVFRSIVAAGGCRRVECGRGDGATRMSVAVSAPLRVAVTALGCKVNFAEMAELAGTLAAAGCDVVPDDESADVRVLNSCTVTMQIGR